MRGDAFKVASVVTFLIIVVSAFVLGLAWDTVPPPGWPLAMCGVVGICFPLTVWTLWALMQSLRSSMTAAVVDAVDDAITRAFNSRLQIVGEQLTERESGERERLMQMMESLGEEMGVIQKKLNRVETGLTAAIGLFTTVIDEGPDDPRAPAPN